jgi:hypothetical protein
MQKWVPRKINPDQEGAGGRLATGPGLEDAIADALREMRCQGQPVPRSNLSEEQKDELIGKIGGPHGVRAIVDAGKIWKPSRVVFLFNSIDPQLVVDVLANDMAAAIERAGEAKRRRKAKGPAGAPRHSV